VLGLIIFTLLVVSRVFIVSLGVLLAVDYSPSSSFVFGLFRRSLTVRLLYCRVYCRSPCAFIRHSSLQYCSSSSSALLNVTHHLLIVLKILPPPFSLVSSMSYRCQSFSFHLRCQFVMFNHPLLSFYLVYFSLVTFSPTPDLFLLHSMSVHLTFALFSTPSNTLLSLISLNLTTYISSLSLKLGLLLLLPLLNFAMLLLQASSSSAILDLLQPHTLT